MNYGWTKPKRKKYIEDEIRNKDNETSKGAIIRTETIKFKGELITLPVIRVPVELPKYWLLNGRTRSLQVFYKVKNNLTEDFFNDTEFIDAQKAQHEFLKKLAVKGVNLFHYFKKRKQEIPIILTPDGIVINGSRRLCTWRELADTGFAEFMYVDAIILPSSDERDLKKLEFELQKEKDIKVDYDWCSEALDYKNDLDFMTSREISTTYEIEEKKILQKISCLNLAENYLEYIDEKLNYEKVVDAEFAFQKIYELRNKFNENEQYKKDIFTTLSFIAMQFQPDSDPGRMWAYILQIHKNIDILIDELDNKYKLSSRENTLHCAGELEELFGEADQFENIAISLSELEQKEEVAGILGDVIETQKEVNKEKDKAKAPMYLIKKTKKLIQRAYQILDDKSDIQGLEDELEEIEDITLKIRKVAVKNDKNFIS
ncbi:hypothetical protein V7200_08565 [Cytobacillus firmus]|uniref:ParB/Sulfiredoxin domain-containing protein n=2 Tax=Cytobacillus firmus TaxID=1399 RepID=A0A800N814_CYTFI|nr:hypothetical protein [Cytobacillus firmus]KAF0821375.1 hypothetical protein KIS1582_4917 [Cytobacillus firmus]